MQYTLEIELQRLKSKVGLAGHLTVKWMPDSANMSLQGNISNSTIFIYNQKLTDALSTLRHEFVEFILTNEFLTPKLFEAKAHRRADSLVDILAKLL